MTAIAAVIALSSTPLLAQATDSIAAPVVVAPPPPTVAPAAATPASEASAPAPVEAIPAPAPAMKTVGTPVVHEADTAPEVSQPAAAPMRIAPVKRTSAAPSARAPAPVAAASLAPTRSAPAKAEATPPPAPVAKTVATPAPAAANTPPVPATIAAQTNRASTVEDETLPIAGGIGLAVLALGGAAYAVSRRRRKSEEGELVLEPAPAAIPVAEPVVVAKATTVSTTHGRTPKTLPSGFDISRFGRHTQAAYLGPTDDNPSFSLKRRLKRASFFDQREREAAEAPIPTIAATAEAPAAQAAAAKQTVGDHGQVTIRLAPQRKRSGLGYLLQR